MRWLTAFTCALVPAVALAADPPKREHLDFFENKVRPVLAEHCYSCHGPKKQSAGLRLDTAAGFKQGADDGPVVGNDPAKSRLLRSVKRQGDYPMPPKTALPAGAAATIEEWVKLGAPYPDETAQAKAGDPAKHWAFQPVKEPAVPKRAAHPIDAFVLATLSDKGLSPAPRADRRTLIRRAYFDLIGLPPTAEEVEAFEKDTSPQAWEKVVDRLLASPHYGERQARYWLDLARYADTKGYVFREDRNFPFAYTYRDYVIKSFNDDKPYDRFVVEQIAADKLPLGADKTPLAAMAFLTIGRRFLNNTHDIIDDRIDVVTRGFLGLTVQCARCHDHKFDPISQKDYYSLYGVFASSVEPKELPLIGEVKRTPELEAFEKDVAKREADIQASVAKRHAGHVAKLRSADGIADYLTASFAARGKSIDQIGGFVRERDLNRYAFDRWRTFLTAELKAGSPVYSPLLALADAAPADYAKVIVALGKDPKKPADQAVVKALTEAKPKTLREAAEAVAKVIAAGPPPAPTDIPLADFDKLQTRADRDQLTDLRRKVDAFKAASAFNPPRAMVLNDGPVLQPAVFLRGNPGNRGATVPRQAPAVIRGPDAKPFTDGSGRLELAKAIADPKNPLTARVMVNRVWLGHFGNGLVRTPSNFGLRADPPTHPELLDYLAARFVRDGWSAKKLHRLIMTSATYQQASTGTPAADRLDPENRLLSHQTRRRLDFEALRDSLLAAAGTLDRTTGGKAVDLFRTPFSTRRTIYGVIDRTTFPGTLRSFDVASPDQHSPQRFQTTVPQQALFLMNSPFVTAQAKVLAARAEVASAATAEGKITRLYRLVLGRTPTPAEVKLGRAFVESAGTGADAAFGPWPQYAQVLLLSNEFAFVD
jgi:hypothetical protein